MYHNLFLYISCFGNIPQISSCIFQIINTVDPKHLKLSKVDDLIYAHFRRDFPDLNVEHIDVDAMKSTEGKAVRYFEERNLITSEHFWVFIDVEMERVL